MYRQIADISKFSELYNGLLNDKLQSFIFSRSYLRKAFLKSNEFALLISELVA